MSLQLDQDGNLILTWKCDNPAGSSGTIYQVWRQIGDAGTLDYLGDRVRRGSSIPRCRRRREW